MSYSRWSHSDWYIWWDSPTSGDKRDEQSICCWGPASAGGTDDDFWKYPKIKEMLALDDFSKVVGYEDKHKDHLRECFEHFVADVEEDYPE